MNAAEKRFISEYWWTLTLRGVIAILFGVAAVFWPGLTILTLLYLFGAYILVAGILDIIHGIGGVSRQSSWFLILILGALELGVGVYLLRHPGVTFTTLVLLIGFILIIRGVMEGVAALGSGASSATNRVLMLFASVIAIAAGIIMLFQPAKGGVAFVWVLGLYALIIGPLMIAMSLDLKKLGEA